MVGERPDIEERPDVEEVPDVEELPDVEERPGVEGFNVAQLILQPVHVTRV